MEKPIARAETADADLVARSLAGDRESFNQIVLRYQTLICSLAYNGLGSLGQSEDVAQETFITAWKQLQRLREPSKLRAWLCGIVRHQVLKNRDRAGREPVHDAEALDAADESPANYLLPSEEAICREEEAILWRSLQNIPPLYRETLVLFYRQHQSIQAVAEELDLSQDAVKQRLARGRALLQQEVQVFVEKTLSRTVPAQGFSSAVLAALPTTPIATLGLGAAGKGAAAANSGLLGTWLAPVIGILSGIAAHWVIVEAAPTDRERRLKRAAFIGLWLFVLGWCIPGQIGMRVLSRNLAWSDKTFFEVMAGFWWCYAMCVATLGTLIFRRVSTIRRESEDNGESVGKLAKPLSRGKRLIVLPGVYLACFWWVIALAWQAQDRWVACAVVVLMIGLALWNFVRLRPLTGVAAARGVASHIALTWGVILAILNWRLTAWEAAFHGIDVAQMRYLLPTWIMPLLTLALVAWVALLLLATRPGRFVASAPS
jgi:RNA polymerase sigma factor (sigma-70 family)